jgi:nucleotide-binding universal stress UspA family protein
MERILVGMASDGGSLWAGIHALNLAKRINAKVSFLLVIDPEADKEGTQAVKDQGKTSMMKRLGTLIEQGRAEGITVDYFITHGKFDKELVQFIKDNKTTMLVVGLPLDSDVSSGNFRELIEKLRHRIDCRIEVVQEKSPKPQKKRRK